MATNSSIEWTDTTWNPVVGCTWASAGCDNCYAARMTRRLEAMGQKDYTGLTSKKHFNGKVRTLEHKLTEPLRWKKPRRVFVNSMSDLFHEAVPFDFVDRVFAVMALCPQHTFQVLTKRPERMAEYLARRSANPYGCDDPVYQAARHVGAGIDRMVALSNRMHDRVPGWPLPNVWLGTSVENQEQADARIPHLLRCPAAVRFLSVEPLLERVNLDQIYELPKWVAPFDPHYPRDADHPRIEWVIVGGESGPGARPCNVEWIRSIVSQCKAAGVPVFVKQLGAVPIEVVGNACMPWRVPKVKDPKGGVMSEWPKDLRVRELPATPATTPTPEAQR